MICRRYLLPFLVLTLSLSGFMQACTSTQPGHVAMDTTDISEPPDQLAPDDSVEPDVSVDSWTPSDTVPTSDTVISDDIFEDVSPLEDVSHDVEPAPLSDVVTDTTEPGFDVVNDVEPDPSHDLCKNIYEGDYLIAKQSDVDVIVDVCAISGNLKISGDVSLTTVSLPLLQSIGGKLYVFGTEPAVFNVDPVNTSLTTLALPTLESLGGSIWIHGNYVLNTIDLSSLASVHNLWIETNPMLDSLLLPLLSNVSKSGFGGQFIVSASSLTTILLPEREAVGSLHVFENGVLKELVAPKLALISSIAPASSHTAAGRRVIGSTANSTACRRQYPAPAAACSTAIISRPDQEISTVISSTAFTDGKTGRRDQVAPRGSGSWQILW